MRNKTFTYLANIVQIILSCSNFHLVSVTYILYESLSLSHSSTFTITITTLFTHTPSPNTHTLPKHTHTHTYSCRSLSLVVWCWQDGLSFVIMYQLSDCLYSTILYYIIYCTVTITTYVSVLRGASQEV